MNTAKYRAKRYYVNPYETQSEYIYGDNVKIECKYKIDDSEPNGFLEYQHEPVSKIYEIDDIRIIPETLQYSIDGTLEEFENVHKSISSD